MVKPIKKLGRKSFFKAFADSPADLAFIEALFQDADQALCDALLEGVDESVFSLPDWVEALRRQAQWLDARELSMELSDQVGYVSCASASAGAGANLTHLPSLLDDMLETYGCDRAVKK
ncbi:MAG: hypothetical protein ACN4GF_10920 [Lentimonas sp.]